MILPTRIWLPVRLHSTAFAAMGCLLAACSGDGAGGGDGNGGAVATGGIANVVNRNAGGSSGASRDVGGNGFGGNAANGTGASPNAAGTVSHTSGGVSGNSSASGATTSLSGSGGASVGGASAGGKAAGGVGAGGKAAGGKAAGGNASGGASAGGKAAGGVGAGGKAAGGNASGGVGAGGKAAGGASFGGASIGGNSAGSSPNAGSAGISGATCPAVGHVVYTLAKVAAPTAAEQSAYDRITAAMDTAIRYYNCYTNITKSLSVSYVPSVATADGNINGSIRFGSNASMNHITAMHEIGHTVGVGTASNWASFVVGGKFTGSNALAQLLAIPNALATTIGADSQHFWPYGLNYESEGQHETDLIGHCQMVVAIRKDLGLQ